MQLHEQILCEAIAKEVVPLLRIEETVCVLDKLGIGGGGRHDF